MVLSAKHCQVLKEDSTRLMLRKCMTNEGNKPFYNWFWFFAFNQVKEFKLSRNQIIQGIKLAVQVCHQQMTMGFRKTLKTRVILL